ncbi:hypothetical protein AKJ58_00950 [candidate division MSBL1 archaeon SCGC-AAA385D11]|uniref:Uncharacterized protein n=1 Tax=candidate division MSBL1 archaeon SCGC-AAA385D11 TaxID=1698286 RepID=A0A133VNV6_9EURY|nr:hypothetical protein AKJ58_00950 [candidate division MSBL1 archaeon SCGC-AAA385D11]
MRAGVKRVENLPIPVEELGTFEEPIKEIDRFPIFKILLESDARLEEPLSYLSTRVGLIHEKWSEMSSDGSLNENMLEKAVQEARKELKKKEKI